MKVTRTTTGNIPITGDQQQRPTIRQGSNGDSVRELQTRLKAEGYDPGPVDGDFGPKTAAAVRRYQQAHGLTVDAVVGPKTWGSLLGTTPTSPTGPVDPTSPTGPTTPLQPQSGTALDCFPIVGQDGSTQNARYNIGYDGKWNNFDPDSARQNSDFSLNQTNASHPTGHLGVDIFAPKGQPVVAPVSGEVVRAGWDETGGWRVTIKRGNEYFYLCHLDQIAPGVRPGTQITAGTKIGTVGNSGSASGTAPHLHFSIFRNNNYRDTVNPFPSLMDAHTRSRNNPNDFF
ncbi:MAG: peptidoglycan DD-metalloendopeptidase family protein [Myxococcales bacterium]